MKNKTKNQCDQESIAVDKGWGLSWPEVLNLFEAVTSCYVTKKILNQHNVMLA